MADIAGSPPPRSGIRAYSRLDYDAPRYPQKAATDHTTAPDNTITLDKIGDFLELDFGRLFVWLRQGLLLAAVLGATGAVGGGAYAVLSKPRYTVTTDIMIDPGNLQVVEGDLFNQPGQVDGQLLTVGSKLRVLTSRSVLDRVVTNLDLVNDPEFHNSSPSGFSLSSLFGSKAAPTDEEAHLAALRALSEHVSATADEKSFVASLQVSSEDTGKAIAIADDIIKSFKAELAEAEADGAAQAAAALASRLDELKATVQTAEERVQAFRRENNLSTSANGQLVSVQTMSALNAQVVDAQSRLIEAQTNYQTLSSAGLDAIPTTGIMATSLATLRDRAASLHQQLTAQSTTLGPRHPTIVNLTGELNAAEAQIRTELDRAVAAAKSAMVEAQANLDALNTKANSLTSDVFSDNELQVHLRELERDAAAKSAVYESFLTRARQITEREQIDTTNVRVISTAVPPASRSWPPRTVVVIALGAIAGFALGMLAVIGLGIVRDLRHPPVPRR